ncbi:hypothetical protein TrRE_jg9531, partial [Triparma retinervis]
KLDELAFILGIKDEKITEVSISPGSEVHQSNSESSLLLVTTASSNSVIFAKKVTASLFPSKSWPNMRRTLCYIRNEIRFYRDYAPVLVGRGVPLPVLLGSTDNFEALGPDHMHCDPGPQPNLEEPLGGMLFLSFLPPADYYQASPLSFDEVCSTLKAIARLHASAWEDVELLEELQSATGIAGSYTLPNRNPIELERVGSNWSK